MDYLVKIELTNHGIDNKIHSIKNLRAVFGLGLKEAKELHEALDPCSTRTLICSAEQLAAAAHLKWSQDSAHATFYVFDVALFKQPEALDVRLNGTKGIYA